jgi:hypothetical protein
MGMILKENNGPKRCEKGVEGEDSQSNKYTFKGNDQGWKCNTQRKKIASGNPSFDIQSIEWHFS